MTRGYAGPAWTRKVAEPACMAGSVLVADPDPGTRELLREVLVHDGYRVDVAADRDAALELVRRGTIDIASVGCDRVVDRQSRVAARYELTPSYDVVIADLAFDLLAAVHARDPMTELVVLALPYNIEDAVACVRRGAFDFVLCPVSVEDLSVTVACAAARRQRLGLDSVLSHVRPNHGLLR